MDDSLRCPYCDEPADRVAGHDAVRHDAPCGLSCINGDPAGDHGQPPPPELQGGLLGTGHVQGSAWCPRCGVLNVLDAVRVASPRDRPN